MNRILCFNELKNIIKNNDCQELTRWFEKYSFIENFIYEDEGNKNALQIACSLSAICTNCIQILLEHVGVKDLLNKDFSGYTALDFAVQKRNIAITEIILQQYNSKNIDADNVIHELIYYIYHKKGQNENDYEEIIKLLLKYIDVNYVAEVKDTCIYWAAKYKLKAIVTTLIENKFDEIDLDSFEDSSAITARKLIKSSNLYIGILPNYKHFKKENINTLYHILLQCKNYKETNKITDIENNYLEINAQREKFKNHYLLIKSTLKYYQEEDLLKRSITYNNTEISKFILENIIFDSAEENQKNIATLLISAAENCNSQIAASILEKVNVSKELVSDSLNQILKKDFCNTLSAEVDYKDCIDVLLNASNLDINYCDEKYNITALHYAARYQNKDIVLKILNAGASLAFEDLQLPLVTEVNPSVLKEHLDCCIDRADQNYIDNSQVKLTINLTCLVPPRKKTQQNKYVIETEVLQEIAKSKELKQLLLHPVILLFIFLKWQWFRYFCWCPFFISFIYTILLVMYIEIKTDSIKIIIIIIIIFLCLEIFQLILQIILPKNLQIEWQFLKLPIFVYNCLLNLKENFVEHLLQIVLIIATIYMIKSDRNDKYDLQGSAVAVLISTILLFLRCGHFSWISVYIIMFRKVTFAFFKLFLWHSILILGFSYSFYIILISTQGTKFDDVGQSLFKSFIMFTGEFNSSEINFDFYPVSYLIFVLFVFLITIVLSNLSSGLAVSDVQEIKNEAEIEEQVILVNYIAYFEKILLSKRLLRKVSRLKKNCFFPQRKNIETKLEITYEPDGDRCKIIIEEQLKFDLKIRKKISDAIQKTRRENKEKRELEMQK